MITIPSRTRKVLTQPNKSNLLGDLYSTNNIDLQSNVGAVRVSPRLCITTNGITSLGTAIGFRRFLSKIFTVAGTKVFVTADDKLEGAFSVDAHTNASTTVQGNTSSSYSDIETYNNELYVSGGDSSRVWYLNSSGTWGTLSTSDFTALYPKKMLHFLKQNRLYTTDAGYKIFSSDTSHTLATSGSYTYISADTDIYITSLLQTDNLIWILSFNLNNHIAGKIITWDGVTDSTPTNYYELDSRGALAGIVKEGRLYIMDTEGKLMYFNGAGFSMMPNGRLPIQFFSYLQNPIALTNDGRYIHPNGMEIINGKINILINNVKNDNGTTIEDNLPSGIWEYDETSGWVHKQSFTQYDFSAVTPTITDFGQNRIANVGALKNINNPNTSADGIIGTILAGATYYTDASTTKAAIFTDDSKSALQKAGSFVSSWIFSQNAEDLWKKIYARYRRLLTATDKIVVKYRTIDEDSTAISLTWTDDTSFTTTTDLTGKIGYEVEFVQGNGSGLCAHITSAIVGDVGYIVSIDESISGMSGTAKARVMNWNKHLSITGQIDELTGNPILLGSASSRIQVKCWMRFTGKDELFEVIVLNGTNKEL